MTEAKATNATEKNCDRLQDNGVEERMQYIRKCYEDTVQMQRRFIMFYYATSCIMLVLPPTQCVVFHKFFIHVACFQCLNTVVCVSGRASHWRIHERQSGHASHPVWL